MHEHQQQHHQHHQHRPDMGHYAAEIDRRYPALYHRVMPYIEQAHMMHGDIAHMDERQLDQLANEVMRNSGVLHHMPRGHSEDTVGDLVKVLLLTHNNRELAAETMAPLVPLALGFGLGSPFFFPFFLGHHFPHHRHHHHRRGFRGHHRGRR